jgi:hypothetical protein
VLDLLDNEHPRARSTIAATRPQARTHRRRKRLLSQVRRARSQLSAAAPVPWEAYVIEGKYDLAKAHCRRSRSFAVRIASITRIWPARDRGARAVVRAWATRAGDRCARRLSGKSDDVAGAIRVETPPLRLRSGLSTSTSISFHAGLARLGCLPAR